MTEKETQPISINVSTQPQIKPEGGLDPWQRYVFAPKIDIPTAAHRFLMGAVVGLFSGAALLTAHAEFYWFAALLFPLAALLLIKDLQGLGTNLFIFGAIAGLLGAFL